MKVKIDTIEISIGKKTIRLSLDEAQELRDILDKTLAGGRVVVERIPYPNPYPILPYYPYERWIWYDNSGPRVTTNWNVSTMTNTWPDSSTLYLSRNAGSTQGE